MTSSGKFEVIFDILTNLNERLRGRNDELLADVITRSFRHAVTS